MAYSNYYPASYQQLYQPYQNSFPTLAQQPQTNVIWVSSEQEAQSYPVAPNNAVALWDSNASVIYLKQADTSGKPSIRAYSLTERDLNAQTPTDTTFAKKDDVDAISREIREIKAELKNLKKKKKEIDDDE